MAAEWQLQTGFSLRHRCQVSHRGGADMTLQENMIENESFWLSIKPERYVFHQRHGFCVTENVVVFVAEGVRELRPHMER